LRPSRSVSALRSFLIRAEGGSGVVATTAFAAGVVWSAISLVAQAIQVALAMAFVDEVPTAVVGPMSDLMFAVLTIGNIPLAVMLIATAAVSLRTKAFPAWWAGCRPVPRLCTWRRRSASSPEAGCCRRAVR
jgi:hypothetical protein